MTDIEFRLFHRPLRPRVDYFGRPMEIIWCPDCERYFHQTHTCDDWRRPCDD
jgi:hypothetical protein